MRLSRQRLPCELARMGVLPGGADSVSLPAGALGAPAPLWDRSFW